MFQFLGQIGRLQDGLGFVPPTAHHVRDLAEKYNNAVQLTKDNACMTALQEEIGLSLDYDGAIGILTDARHGGRRKAKDNNLPWLTSSKYFFSQIN